MLATNMAPVSLSSSLFSVTMCNLGSSPWFLTMSFHIMLLYTPSCSQQAVTQFLCLKVRPVVAVNALHKSDGEYAICFPIRKSLAVELGNPSLLVLFTPCSYVLCVI